MNWKCLATKTVSPGCKSAGNEDGADFFASFASEATERVVLANTGCSLNMQEWKCLKE